MSVRNWVGFVLLAALPGLPALLGQESTQPAQAAASTIDLDVVVAPKSGTPFAGLQQTDFTLLDNKSPQPITSFHAAGGSRAPIHLIVVIDAVNAAYQSIAYTRGEVEKFLRANGGRLAYPTQLAFFTDSGVQIQPDFSTDGNELSSSVEQYKVPLRDIHRSSQYQASDRFNLSIRALGSLARSEVQLPGRKMVLWISPGWPLLSGPGVYLDAKQQDQLFTMIIGLSTQMREARMTLYSLNPIGAAEAPGRAFYYQDFLKGVSKPGQVAIGDLSLQVLASQSGGLALFGDNNLTSLLEQCVADGKAYYELSFVPTPAAHGESYHHIEVQVATPGLTARTRDGYYWKP